MPEVSFDFDSFDLSKVQKYDLSGIKAEALSASGKPTLFYFAGSPGRSEVTRLALLAGAVSYTETLFEIDKWYQLTASGSTPAAKGYGSIISMPYIHHGDTVKLGYNIATTAYAADIGMRRKRKPTLVERSMDTMVVNAAASILDLMYPIAFAPTEKTKQKMLEAYPDQVHPVLEGLDKICGQVRGPFIYSSTEPSLGDLALFDLVTNPGVGILQGGVDVHKYPRLEACAAAVQKWKGPESFANHMATRKDGWTVAAFKPFTPTDVDSAEAGSASLPTPQGASFELVYFDGVGRGQLMRYLLMAGGIEFKDTRIPQNEWKQVKEDPNSLPGSMFKQMPVLAHGEHKIAQCVAIAEYVADLGINQQCPPSPSERAMDTSVHTACDAIRVQLYKVVFSPEGKAKQALQRGLPAEVNPILKGIEFMYSANAHTPYLYRSEDLGPSLGDIAVLDVIFSSFPGVVKLQAADLAQYPKIALACKQMATKMPYPALREALKKDLEEYNFS